MQFAADLTGRWHPADGVEPWLRDVEPELTRKVQRERWSWEAIARSLNEAGIRYETDRPWTGKSLGMKIASIRYEQRLRSRPSAQPAAETTRLTGHSALAPLGDAARNNPDYRSERSPGQDVRPSTNADGIEAESTPEEPVFRPATLRSGYRPKPPSPTTSQTSPTAVQATDDELMTRWLGKSSKP